MNNPGLDESMCTVTCRGVCGPVFHRVAGSRHRPIIVFAIVACLLSTVCPALAEEPLWVAIMKTDRVLIPIGRYEAGSWHVANPGAEINEEDQKRLGVPASLVEISRQASVHPLRWFLSTASESDYLVRSGKIIKYQDEFHQPLALETDYPILQKPAHWPIGAATSKPSVLLKMRVVSSADAINKKILAAVRMKWEASEDRVIEAQRSHSFNDHVLYSGHPLAKHARAKTELSSVTILQSEKQIGGKIFYQISAAKEYMRPPGMPDTGCKGFTYFRTWLTGQSGSLLAVSHSAWVSDCDGKGGSMEAAPFGLISVDGRVFSITEELSYHHHDYFIYEIRDDGLQCVLAFYSGSCK